MNEDQPRFVDAAGCAHAPAGAAPRIISLAPPLGDLCLALGLADAVVGRSEEVGSSQDTPGAGVIVGPAAAPDLDRIEQLAPTHVLAHLARTPAAVRAVLAERGIAVVAVRPRTPADNFDLFSLVGGIFSARTAADTLARRLEAALARIKMALLKKRVRRILFFTGREPDRVLTPASYPARMLALARLAVVGPEDVQEEEGVFQPSRDVALGVDAILLAGANGAFRRADIREIAEIHGVGVNKVHLVEERVEDWYGVRAISAVDELIDLRRRLARAWARG